LQHPEHLPEGESKEQHEELAAQEQAIVDVDKSNTEEGGLFKGVFDKPNRPLPIHDDGIERCPFCTWELEPGDGPLCPRCGQEHDAGSVSGTHTVTSTSEGGGEHHHDHQFLDEEVDEDDMYDDDEYASLYRGPLGGHPIYDINLLDGVGNEPYYISSDDSENESVRIVGARQRAMQRQAHQEPHVHHHHHHHHHHMHGSHSPDPSDLADFSPVDSDVADHWTAQPRRQRPVIVEDEEEESDSEDDEETGSVGSLRDFVADDEEGRSEGDSTSASRSVDEDEDDDEGMRPVAHGITGERDEAPFSDRVSLQSGSSESSAAMPELSPQQRRALQMAMSRHIGPNRRVRRPWDDDYDNGLDIAQDTIDDYRDEWAEEDHFAGEGGIGEDDMFTGEGGTGMNLPRRYGMGRVSGYGDEYPDHFNEAEDEHSEDEGPVRTIRWPDGFDEAGDEDSEDEAPIRRTR